MTERISKTETVTETSAAPRETVEKDYVTGAPHGDEEAGGAVGGAVAGAVVGAVDEKAKDDTVVVTREVRR